MSVPKKHPLVDPLVYDLAHAWMSECYALTSDAEDAGDNIDEAAWDLAGEIQNAIEDWLNDAESTGRLRLLRGGGQ